MQVPSHEKKEDEDDQASCLGRSDKPAEAIGELQAQS